MTALVCPACGSARFEQVRTTRTRFTVEVFQGGATLDVADLLEDGGEWDDGPLECTECGDYYDPEGADLVSEEYYLDTEAEVE